MKAVSSSSAKLSLRGSISERLARFLRCGSLLGVFLVPALTLGQTFIQGSSNSLVVNASTVSVAYPAAETAGNLNLVVVGWGDTTSSVISVVDDNANTYVLAGTSAGNGVSQAVYYAANIVLPTNPPTVTVTFNQNAGFPDVRIFEYSGLSTTKPLDNWVGSTGVSTLADSSAATTSATDLIVGAGTTGGSFTLAGAGFTSRGITNGFGDIVEDSGAAVAAGSHNATAALLAGSTWVMQAIGFSTTPVTYPAAPSISSTTPITPASGPDVGGSSVTISGTNFHPGAIVLFGTAPGGISGINCTESGGTTITCLTPADSAGVKDITVVNVDGQLASSAAAYTDLNAAPTFTAITPATGSTNGSLVTVTGTNFQTGANVTVGGLPAGDIVVQSQTSISANVPAHAVGAVNVTVKNPDGGTITGTGAFTYALGTEPIKFVQRGGLATAGTATTMVGVLANLQTAGNLNVVVIGWSDIVAQVVSVADTEGNTYTAALPVSQGTTLSQVIYYAKNITGDTSTPNQVTVTFNQAAVAPDVQVMEYSGLDTTSPLDAVAGKVGSGALADTGACTFTAPVDLILAGATVGGAVLGPGQDFNMVTLTVPNADASEQQLTQVPGSCEATATLTNSDWVMQAVAFKAVPGPAPNFTLSAAPATANVLAGTAATSTITVTPANGFTKPVTLTCDPLTLPTDATCAFSPNLVVAGAGPATSALTISTTTATPGGVSSMAVTGTFGSLSRSTAVDLTVTAAPVPDFTVAAAPPSPASVTAGGSATSTVTIAPVNGFNSAVSLTCSIAPVVTRPATCSFSPASVAGGSGTSTLTVSTTAATTASLAPRSKGVFFAMWLPIGGLALAGTGLASRKKKLWSLLFGCLIFSGLIFLTACGGGSSSGGTTGHPGTPAGSYTITVTGTSGATTHSQTVTLTVN